MSQYFDPDVPQSDAPGRQGERLWDFIERSSWVRSQRAREQFARFLDRVPPQHRPAFISRLQPQDEREVYAAHSELFVHAVMLGIGVGCELDPATPGGSRTDMRLETGTHLEVHRSSLSNADKALQQRRRDVVRGLEEVRSPDFWLKVKMSVPGATPSIRRIRDDIEDWLNSLDWRAEHERMRRSPARYEAPSRKWQTPDGHVVLAALPKGDDSRGKTSAVGMISGGPLLTEGFETLEKNVRRKRRQHQSLTEPLVVVLDLSEGLSHQDEIAAALYGPEVDYVDAIPRYQKRDRSRGVWPAPDGPRRPSAVMTIDHLTLSDASTAETKLWLAPGESNPVGVGPWDVASLDAGGEMVNVEPAVRALSSLL